MVDSVILVGDSIRLSYQPYVALRARPLTVWGPPENCRSSRFLLENLEPLVLSHLHDRSLVHVNAGAHDIKRHPESEFEPEVDLREYGRNIVQILFRLQEHPLVAGVVVATTTPVVDDRHQATQSFRRHEADVALYNTILQNAAQMTGCPVNDLHAAVMSCPFDPIGEDGIHLNELGKEYLGAAVAKSLSRTVADRLYLRDRTGRPDR